MKLRNKKTGGIIEIYVVKDQLKFRRLDVKTKEMMFNSLAELNEEWEDYEEPKEYWYLNSDGIAHATDSGKYPDSDFLREEIGNYFETCEEVEKAVKKLKAYKRLKDVGFKFCGTDRLDYTNCIKYSFASDTRYDHEEMLKDLDLLFGGEE